MRLPFLAVAGLLAFAPPALAGAKDATIYKHPQCGCCTGHAKYLEKNGYTVKVVETEAIDSVKTMSGIPADLQSCHTAVIDGYVVEGHVPVAAIDKLLAERPKVKGIALPGMPQGSPGMSGDKEGPFVVYTIEAQPKVFAEE